jgi:16S rRNA (cytosine967-C5)-methyltransferase
LASGGAAPTAPRAAAARAVAAVLGGRSLSDALPDAAAAVPDADRALVAELAYGTCRWFPRLDFFLGRLLARPLKSRDADIRALLLVGLYQLTETRVPPHAAVDESVAAARALGKDWATGLVNGVLRAFQRDRARLEAAAAEDPAAAHAHPAWLLARLRAAWPDEWRALVAAGNERPPMTLRVNRLRGGTADYRDALAGSGLAAAPVAGVPSALVLAEPVAVDRLPGFREGAVSVQDAGAQLAAPLLDCRAGDAVLDACAAPGGKTGHLLEWCPEARVTAVDIDPRRLDRVSENLRRLGLSARLAQGDAGRPAGEWAADRYDRILLDVPCTATGVVRRHPDIKLLRRARDVGELVARQGQILDAVWPLLRPGGILLYVTCSVLPDENQDQIGRFLDRRRDARALPIDAPWGRPSGAGRQIRTGDDGMDGFYYARLARADAS